MFNFTKYSVNTNQQHFASRSSQPVKFTAKGPIDERNTLTGVPPDPRERVISSQFGCDHNTLCRTSAATHNTYETLGLFVFLNFPKNIQFL